MPAIEKSSNPYLSDSELLESEIIASRGEDRDPSKLTIGSYNIRYGVGQFLISTGLLRKAGFNFPRHRSRTVMENVHTAARVLNSSRLPELDVLGLQEADKKTARSGGLHVAQELARTMEMSWVHAPAGLPRNQAPMERQWWLDFEEQIDMNDSGDTGVALLSRLPLEDLTRIDLPWKECPWRPRLSIAATVVKGGTRIRLFNSHIDPHSSVDGQMDQIEMVLEHANQTDLPVVLLGDFNTLSRRKCVETRRLIESHGFATPFPTGTPTWRGAGIRLHADWIFVRDLEVSRWGVVKPLSVSDHWPIWVEIDLK